MNREILKAVLEKAQNELIDELCGRRYARGEGKKFRRAGTAKRTLEMLGHRDIKTTLIYTQLIKF